MSSTVSVGLVDAAHWAGMASSLAAHITTVLDGGSAIPPTPIGQIAAAERFFNHVLDGVDPDAVAAAPRRTPTMAGISNVTIAANVLAALSSTPELTDGLMKNTVSDYLACLRELRESRIGDRETAERLRDFLRELRRQGSRARESAFALGARPVP